MAVHRAIGCVHGSTGIPISKCSADGNVNVYELITGASVTPGMAGGVDARPKITIESPALESLLTAFGMFGAFTNLSVYFGSMASGRLASGSVHTKVIAATGLAYMDSWNVQAGQPLLVPYTCCAASANGTTSPFVVSSNNAAPTDALVTDEAFTVGKVVVGAVTLEPFQISFNPNAQVYDDPNQGHFYPTVCSLLKYAPEFRVRVRDAEKLASITTGGVGESDVLIYLRRKSGTTGGVYADVDTKHMLITLPRAFVGPSNYGGQVTAAAEGEFVIKPAYDGTNDIVEFTADQAIA